jgi:hypothetical protein
VLVSLPLVAQPMVMPNVIHFFSLFFSINSARNMNLILPKPGNRQIMPPRAIVHHDNASTAFHYITQLKKLGIIDIYYLDNFHLMVLESSNNAEGSVVTKQRCSWNWYD